ncbi:MAG: hypothetical protein KF696_10530 [Planctomycetes bacterium]|nr:hypothetical protein [Planctomycetota bacterium]MCW8135134.1 hypothetical protein [Planctomycetota bacterium]
MLEFAQAHYLWLLLLLVAFYVGWLLARRYRKRRVTHAALWQRVAARVVPPAWKRLLRTILTLLVATTMLACVALYAAGLQRSPDEQPAPLVLVIMQDNTVSMRGADRRVQANKRARALLAALGEDDRALLAHFKFGQPLLGQWLQTGADPGPPPPTDFARPDLRALRAALESLPPPPNMPARPAPRRMLVWLGDGDPALPPMQGVQVVAESFGAAARNDAVIRARYTPPARGESQGGIVEAELLSGKDPIIACNGKRLEGRRVELPPILDSDEVTITVREPDALTDDDAISFRVPRSGIRTVALCHPASDGEANPFLKTLIETLLPGREVTTVAVPAAAPIKADLLVADRALPQSFDARALLLFGVALPGDSIGPPVRAEPNLRAPVERTDVGFEVPDLSLVHAREAVPLTQTGLAPLVRHIEGAVLVAASREPRPTLYCGFVPHQSTLLEDPAGRLLLLRFTDMVQAPAVPRVAPLLPAGKPVTLRATRNVKDTLSVAPHDRHLWQDSYRGPAVHLVHGPDGSVDWQVPDQPGQWLLKHGDVGVDMPSLVWFDPVEQALPFAPAGGDAMAAILPPARQSNWRDLLPALLLWLALGLLVLEWCLWLAGVLE